MAKMRNKKENGSERHSHHLSIHFTFHAVAATSVSRPTAALVHSTHTDESMQGGSKLAV